MPRNPLPKARSILYSKPMCDAINAGRKTQTRRIVKHPDWLACLSGDCPHDRQSECDASLVAECPFGKPGDHLVFLASWSVPAKYNAVKPTGLPRNVRMWSHFDGGDKPAWAGKMRPGRFMPLWMRSRMPRAVIEDVRIQRVQEISESDAIAEGGSREGGVKASNVFFD